MSKLEVGQVGKHEEVVAQHHFASSMKSGDVDVFSTPSLVAFAEAAAVDCVKGKLGEDETSVGTSINISHLAATPLGLKVRAEATLEAINGRKLSFKVVVFDDKEKIGEGTHERVILNKSRFISKANSKLASA
eukprot:Phypoly_transcript_23134.p1 GENE.Phypoly_transcript_23134~~Phypoly_transcript_23134.p1  ORF type:complete len:133 (+),score=37.29 Phypoly_transcript_23134:92-490(+)